MSHLPHQIRNFPLTSSHPYSKGFRNEAIHDFVKALEWTHALAYGRNRDRGDPYTIFQEKKGSCSTKHAALALAALENEQEIDLRLIICKVDQKLVPQVTPFLEKLGVDYFPGSHCYLYYEGLHIDVSFPDQAPFLKAEVLKSLSIQPSQIGEFKQEFHRHYLKEWIQKKRLQWSLDEVWSLRESWIESLAKT